MAKSADAADLKSADPKGLWGVESPSGHQSYAKARLKPRSFTAFRISPAGSDARQTAQDFASGLGRTLNGSSRPSGGFWGFHHSQLAEHA